MFRRRMNIDNFISVEQPLSTHILDASWSLRRLTVAQYHWLIERGFFTDNDRLELIDGYPFPIALSK